MFYNTCTQKQLEMGELHVCFCLQGHSAHEVSSCRWQSRESDCSSAASGHPGPSPLESSETNININEGPDQPAGKTDRRRKAGIKKMDWTKKRDVRIKAIAIWRVCINSPRWRKNRRRDRKSGGMNGTNRPAAGKQSPLITSQLRPVLEVTFKVRTCEFLSTFAPQNQVRRVAVTGRKDQQPRQKIKIRGKGKAYESPEETQGRWRENVDH